METTPTSRTSPVAPPSEEQELSNGRTLDSSNQSDNAAYSTNDQGSRVEPHSQSHSLFESRGNLDTLAAAALKPLADNSFGERNQTSQPYQPPPPLNHHHHRHHHPHHAEHNHSHPDRPDPSPNGTRAVNAGTSDQCYPSAPHDGSSSRFHYREKGQQPSDEDSEEDSSSQLRRTSYHSQDSRPQVHSEQGRRSPYYSAMSPRESFEQDQIKPNSTSSMSISSLLGDSSSKQVFPHKQLDKVDSNPAGHATRSGDSLEKRRTDGGATDVQDLIDEEIRPRRRSISPGEDSNPEKHLQKTHHHRDHFHHHPREGLGAGVNATGLGEQYHQHHHHHDQAHAGDIAQHHHHHLPHQHHQHNHGHLHHHHPQHIMLQHQHQHPHPHAQLHPQPASLHHHHHHAHHHHFHRGRSSSSTSAFSYVPRSLGLRLSPKLKVNATQVYISYLIQLDQMQRAQHLMRSEKRKSIHGDTAANQAEPSRNANHKQHYHSHVRTPSCGEPSRNAQVVPHQEEIVERDNEERSPSSEASDERKKRHVRKSEDAEMNPIDTPQPESSDRTSPAILSHAHSLTHPQHSHPHTHSHSHPHLHPYQHTHGHVHSHIHGHHTAPVLPAHIHPAQHHHHILPSSTKLERGSTKASNSQSVHRHHTLHHHHPHHHPYHPNHPNHQHHFHHHGLPPSHSHGHNHNHNHNHNHGHHLHAHALMHGHNHAHLHHAHPHNHGSHIRSHSHSRSPSTQKNSILERTHRERGYTGLSSQPSSSQTPVPSSTTASPLVKPTSSAQIIDSGHEAGPASPHEHERQSFSLSPHPKDDNSGQQPDREELNSRAQTAQRARKDIDESGDSNQREVADSRPSSTPPTSLLAGSGNAMLVD